MTEFERDVTKRLERIERILKELQTVKRTSTWVKVGIVQEVTGWNSSWMVKARENGLVKYRKGKDGIEYKLESIHPMFLKVNKESQINP